MLGQLDCGAYSVRVVTRGALGVVWEEVPFTSLSWQRVVDDTSQATVPIDGIVDGCAAKDQLAKTRTWEHEIVIYRNGSPVWCGPLVNRKANGTGVILTGRDRTAWWDRRFVHGSYDFETIDLATIFQTYFDDAMSLDPVAGFTCQTTPTGITGIRQVSALDHVMAGDEMRAVAQLGVDYTAIVFGVVAGGRTIPTGRLPVITDDHLVGDPDVEEDGLSKGNHFVETGGQPIDPTTGQTIDGPKVFGEVADTTLRALDGLLEVSTNDDQILDSTSATAGAASSLALNGQGGAIISQLVLGANAPMTIDQIVPGALIDVELSRPAIPVSAIYRISQVDVAVDVSSGEVVTITVQPIGTT